MWAEYYLENYGWIPLDVAWEQFDTIDDKHFGAMHGMAELVPYSNYFFNYTSGPDESDMSDSQNILLAPYSTGQLSGTLVENVIGSVQKMNQARLAIFFEKLSGMPLIFPSEAKEVDRILVESELQLQNALELWEENPNAAETELANAVASSEKAMQQAWMLVGYALAIFVAIFVVLLVALFLAVRHKTRLADSLPSNVGLKETRTLFGKHLSLVCKYLAAQVI
jgi:hypothetical protein